MYFESAKEYNKAELSLVNLHPIMGEMCGCGNPECKMAGKHPQNSNWQKTIGTSNAFDCLENYHSFGIDCTGFGFLLDDHHLVVDVDPKNGGFESFERLAEIVPELKECSVTVKTGGGGFHLYYNKPTNFLVRGTHPDFKGIDFKHVGGFVVAAGSLHKSGQFYELELDYDGSLDNFDDAPEKLLSIIEKVVSKSDYYGDFEGDLSEVMKYVPNHDEDYDHFIAVGMAIQEADPNGFELWDKWASLSSKYDPKLMLTKWNSFDKSKTNKITIATLIKIAIANGYKLPAKGGCDVVIPDAYKADDNELNADHIDILQPHGLVGDIVNHINDTAFRERPAIAVASALWSVSCAMNRMYQTPDGGKVSMIAMCIAASGSGKDNPYQVAKRLLIDAGYGAAVYPEMASAQDMIKTQFEHQVAFYAMDEAHKIFGAMHDKIAPTYLKQVEGGILNLSTERLLTMRSADSRAFTERVLKDITRNAAMREEAEPSKEFIFDHKDTWLRKKLDYEVNGLENPFMSIYATSTPANLDGMVSAETLASGLMGRTLVFREYEDFPLAKSYGFGSNQRKPVPAEIQERFNNIVHRGRSQDKTMTYREDFGLEFWSEPIIVSATEEATRLSARIGAYFDSKAQNSAIEMQPVWARGFQQVACLASIMSAESAIIDREDILYAFALVKNDINTKTAMCLQSVGDAKDADDSDRGNALVAKLISICNTKDGLSPSVIKRKTKKYAEADVQKCLHDLIELGSMKRIEKEWNGRKSVKFGTIKNNFI